MNILLSVVMKSIKHATLCVIKDSEKVLLGMKKQGFGEGKYNGFGGKVEEGETVEAAAIRELYEESSIKATNVEKVAELDFKFPYKKEFDQIVHVYLVKEWEGEPNESKEMKPEWFKINKIPFNKMWADDKHWLPLVLEGKKLNARFSFKEDNETIHEKEIKEL